MGGDSCAKGCEFQSRHHILDGNFSHLFVVKIRKIVMFIWKDENKWKRGRGWPIFLKKQVQSFKDWWNPTSPNQWYKQCYQIGTFLKGDNCSCKSSWNVRWHIGLLLQWRFLVKTMVVTFSTCFGKMGDFLIQHLVTLVTSTKVAQIFRNFVLKTAVASFGKDWATFYCNIWSHCY